MSVRKKLVIIVLTVALAPLIVSLGTTLKIHTAALEEQLSSSQEVVAQHTSARLDDYFLALRKTLQNLSGAVDWASLSAEERGGLLWLIHGQTEDALVIAIVRGKDDIETTAYLGPQSAGDGQRNITAAAVDAFTQHAVHTRVRQQALGRALFSSKRHGVVLPLWLPLPEHGDDGASLLIGIRLARVCQLMQAPDPQTTLHVLDRSGRDVCANLVPAPRSLVEAFAGTTGTVSYTSETGEEYVTSFHTDAREWKTLIQRKRSAAFAPSRRIRNQSIFWVLLGVVGAVGAGAMVARAIDRPIKELTAATRQIAGGDFEHRVALEGAGNDEFFQLASAFNQMCQEIETWHKELNTRVDERTKELRDAQSQLLESRKIAAMASLGAGIAHEINNPLTAVLAFTQLLLAQAHVGCRPDKEVEALKTVESSARRIRDIVRRMQSLSRDYAGEGFVPLSPAALIKESLAVEHERLKNANVQVTRHVDGDLPAVLGNGAQLREVLCQVIDNAVHAMKNGERKLLVEAACTEGELVTLRVTDSGCGIPAGFVEKVFEPFATTKQNWTGKGLGLAVAHRIVEAHHGTLRVDSTSPAGTSMVIVLPVARQGAHLV